jgi:hypothetical protein
MLLALATAIGGCASAQGPAPAAWLPGAHELPHWPYGSSAVVRLAAKKTPPIRGELIALGRDSLYVLTDSALVAIPCRAVRSLALQVDQRGLMDAPHLDFGRSEVDYPFGLGNHATGQPADQPLSKKWQTIRPYARFPGGLPDSLDRSTLTLPRR